MVRTLGRLAVRPTRPSATAHTHHSDSTGEQRRRRAERPPHERTPMNENHRAALADTLRLLRQGRPAAATTLRQRRQGTPRQSAGALPDPTEILARLRLERGRMAAQPGNRVTEPRGHTALWDDGVTASTAGPATAPELRDSLGTGTRPVSTLRGPARHRDERPERTAGRARE